MLHFIIGSTPPLEAQHNLLHEVPRCARQQGPITVLSTYVLP
jgi:hypothetical protein